MHIEEISWEKLDKVNSARKHSQITQSSAWGNVMENEGRPVFIKGFYNQGGLRSAWLMIKYPLGLGMSYFYSPRIDFSDLDIHEIRFIAREIEQWSLLENAIFWRFDSLSYFAIDDRRPIPTISVQPEASILIDLGRPAAELLSAMHAKTRYNIRLAEKNGVIARPAAEADFDSWWLLMKQTVQRDGFRLHQPEHYRCLTSESGGKINLWVAEYQDRIISGNIISWFGDTASYLHGASGNDDRNVMAPYLLQCQIMLEAQRRSYKYYDLNGIDEDRWPGVTRFKRGFGGREIRFPGTFDLVFNQMTYKLYQTVRRLRRKAAGRGQG